MLLKCEEGGWGGGRLANRTLSNGGVVESNLQGKQQTGRVEGAAVATEAKQAKRFKHERPLALLILLRTLRFWHNYVLFSW